MSTRDNAFKFEKYEYTGMITKYEYTGMLL